MNKRTYQLFVEDIIEAINKIERYVIGFSYETFEKNDMVVDAVIRNLDLMWKGFLCSQRTK